MLISAADWRHQPVAEQLPAILKPLGVHCVGVSLGHEATDLLKTMNVHIAIVDFAIPLREGESESARSAAVAISGR